jgi:hypothetical protein
MVKKPSRDTVREYCSKALPDLVSYEMTRLDRTTLIYQSLIDAGFDPTRYHPTANSWLADCFTTQSDRDGLTTALDASFTAAPQPSVENPDNWPAPLKSAMGCWITNQSGTWCQRNAPDPKSILESAMASEVYVGVVELATVDLSALPTGRKMPKAILLGALKGAADGFSCFSRGLIITKGDQPYHLSVTISDSSIKSIQIIEVSAEEGQCLGP